MAKKFKADSTAQPSISGSENPPTHGVGGGVVSRKPAKTMSQATEASKPLRIKTPTRELKPKQSPLATYLKKQKANR